MASSSFGWSIGRPTRATQNGGTWELYKAWMGPTEWQWWDQVEKRVKLSWALVWSSQLVYSFNHYSQRSSMYKILLVIPTNILSQGIVNVIMFEGSKPIYVYYSLKEREKEVQKCWLKTWDVKIYMIDSLIGVYPLVFKRLLK